MADENKKEEAPGQEEKKEKEFSKRTTQLIALSALVLAICATFSSLKAGAFSSKAILAQNAASNGWAYYQSKSLKENTYKVQLDQMKLAAASLDPVETPKLMEKYQLTVDRYKAEEKEIMQEARAAEATRDHALELNKGFAGALTFLQIAILMVSLAGLVKQIWFWYAGLAVGAVGVFQFATMMTQAF